MCVGALLESDVEALVYAVANDQDGAAGHDRPARPAPCPAAPDQGRQRHPPGRGRALFEPLPLAERRASPPDGRSTAGLVSSPAERCPSG